MDTYEKKYKEALKRAKKLQETCDSTAVVGWCEYIFPELKESEDKLTWLTKYIEEEAYWLSLDIRDDEDRIKLKKLQESLAWLKKQGEQKLANSCKSCKDEPFDYENATIIQKDFAPNVEAKFKVGDWVANDYCVGKVIELTDDAYLLDTGQGIPFSCEHNAHLWTIQDAKDGDVLCLYYNNRKTFFIFKAIIGEGDYADILVHCCYTGKYQYLEPSFNGECRMHQISDGGYCLPADKEEQDILFQKMHEAGYMWDSEKKELKKIPQRMVSAEAKEAMYDKPAWSEEDNKHYESCLQYFEEIKPDSVYYKDYLWLKSLKQRIKDC